jgi:hypothetical protein
MRKVRFEVTRKDPEMRKRALNRDAPARGPFQRLVNCGCSKSSACPGAYALDLGVPNGPDSIPRQRRIRGYGLGLWLLTGGFLTVTLPSVPETGVILFSLVIGFIALFGFHLLQRQRLRA